MKARAAIATAAVLAVLLGAGWASAAEGIAGRFAIAAQVGTQTELGGNLLANGQGTIAGLPVTFQSVGYRDVYAPDVRVQGFLGYGVNQKVEIVLRGGWYKTTGTGVGAGTLNGKDLFAYFTDYEEWGVEVAARYYIAHATRLKSWIAPVAGLRSTKTIYVSYSIPDAGDGGAERAVQQRTRPSPSSASTSASRSTSPTTCSSASTPACAGRGRRPTPNALPTLGTIDDSESRWTAPVMLSLGVRF